MQKTPTGELRERSDDTQEASKDARLDSLLNLASSITKQGALSGIDLDRMIEEGKLLKMRKKTAESTQASRLALTDRYADLSPYDYKGLEAQGLIDQDQRIKYERLEDTVTQLETAEYRSRDANELLASLKEERARISNEIGEVLARRRERAEAVRSRVEDMYLRRLERYRMRLEEIENNPLIAKRLKDQAEEQKAAEGREVKEQRAALITEVGKRLDSMGKQIEASLKKITEVIGEERTQKLREVIDRKSEAVPRGTFKLQDLKGVMDSHRREENALFAEIRKALVTAINNGKINHRRELVPWYMQSSVDYWDVLHFLNAESTNAALQELEALKDSKAAELLRRKKRLLAEGLAIRLILGDQMIDTGKNQKKGELWQALEDAMQRQRTKKQE